MDRFRFHLKTSDGQLCDEEGVLLSGVDAAREHACLGVRAVISDDVLRYGVIDLSGLVVVENDAGECICVVQFSEAVKIRNGDRASA